MKTFLCSNPSNNVLRVSTTYYFRQIIPTDLRHRIARTEVKVSLRTADKRLAKQKGSYLYAMMWGLFTSLRKGTENVNKLTCEQIQELVRGWINQALDNNERQLSTRGHTFRYIDEYGNDITAEELSYMYQGNAYDRKCELVACDHSAARSWADELLEQKNLTAPKESDEYKLFCRELLKGQITILNILSERVKGNYHSRHEITRHRLFSGASSSARVPTALPYPPEMNKTLSEIATEYVSRYRVERKWTPKTTRENESKFKFFIEIMEDPKLKDITQTSLNTTRELLFKYPKNKTKSKIYKGWSLVKIKRSDIPSEHRLSVKTLETYCTQLNALLEYAITFCGAPKWFAEIVVAPKPDIHAKTNESRDVFTTDELTKIFTDLTNVSTRAEFWLPLLALFTGARAEELAQLHLSDIQIVQGIPCISIDPLDSCGNKVKWVKNSSSIRRIPIHEQLLDLGFMGLVEDMRKAGMTRLFEDLKPSGKDGKFSVNCTKNFNRHLKTNKMNIVGTGGGAKVFYSFRHTFINYCAQNMLPKDFYERVAGHSAPNAGVSEEHYIKEILPEILYREVIAKIDFGIDLSCLKGHKHTKLDNLSS